MILCLFVSTLLEAENGPYRARSANGHQFSCGIPRLAKREIELNLKRAPELSQLVQFHLMQDTLQLLINTMITMLKSLTVTNVSLEIKEDLIPSSIFVSQERKELLSATQQEKNILPIGILKNKEGKKVCSEVILDAVLHV